MWSVDDEKLACLNFDNPIKNWRHWTRVHSDENSGGSEKNLI